MVRDSLQGAAALGRAADVAALLAAGADVNQANEEGATPLFIASANGHAEVVTKLLAANASVDRAENNGVTPLYIACEQGHAEIVTKLLAANATVDQADNDGVTPLSTACERGHTEVVTIMLAANANANQADNRGITALIVACQHGQDEVVAKLLDANAAVEQADNEGTPMFHACENGHLGCVQLLSSYGASRTFAFDDPESDTAEHIAMSRNYTILYNGLIISRHWTPLHHFEVLTPERARALMRAGASANAGDPSPLDRAKELCSSGRFGPGSAAHVVLEWGAPWRRTTHKFYPPAVRARVAVLMRIAQAIKRGKAAYEADGVFVAFASPAAVADVFESCVIPHDIASERW